MLRKFFQFYCNHKDAELIDLCSHDSSTGITICYYKCRRCGKGFEK